MSLMFVPKGVLFPFFFPFWCMKCGFSQWLVAWVWLHEENLKLDFTHVLTLPIISKPLVDMNCFFCTSWSLCWTSEHYAAQLPYNINDICRGSYCQVSISCVRRLTWCWSSGWTFKFKLPSTGKIVQVIPVVYCLLQYKGGLIVGQVSNIVGATIWQKKGLLCS